MIITIIITVVVFIFLMYAYSEKQELKQQNNNPWIMEQKREAARKEREEIEKRNSSKGTMVHSDSKKDCTNGLIKTAGFYVTKTEKPDGYLFLYFRKDGYVLMNREEFFLNTDAVNDTKNYIKKIHRVLNKLNEADLSFDFGKYYIEGKKIRIDFLFIDDTPNPYGDIELESSITMNGNFRVGQLTLSSHSKAYKRLFKRFEERTMFELSPFTYVE